MFLKFWGAAALIAAAQTALAQGPAPSPFFTPAPAASPRPEATPSALLSAAPELTRADLEPFLEGLMNSQLLNRNMAGAVIAVVADGKLVLAKGYGYADFEKKKPVAADETLFRAGSISKLFNAVAVMQLVEAGQLDLDKDVREYLDFEIPRSFPEPITLRRILTHTAGFEESLKNLFAPADRPLGPLRDYLITHIPAQIFRPGTVPAYSNYAVALSGYIVGRVAQQPFEEYVEKHIFAPLKMTSSTFEQPPPGPLASQVSLGYTTPEKKPKPFELCSPIPAGGLSTTATDMSRFMLALLNGGTLEDATIIRPESLAQMQSRQFELDPNLHAMGLGFMEYTRNGHTMWGHGGDTIVFHSDLFLIPDAHVGVYLSYNSAGAQPGSARGEVLRAFMTRYFPEVELPPRTRLTDTVAHGREVAGVYEVSRKSETNPLKIGALLGQMSVSSDRDGVIMIEGAKNARGLTKRWREVAPYFYDEIDGPGHVAFRRDQNGQVTDLLPDTPIDIGQRVSGFASKTVLMPLIGGSLGFIALTLLLWPVAAFVRRRYGRVLWLDRTGQVLHVLARIVCLILLAMLATFGLPLARVGEDVGYLGEKMDPWLTATHVLGWIGSLGLLAIIAAAVRAWRTNGIGWWPRVHSTVLMISAVTFVLFAWRFHLLSPSLKF